MAKIYQRKVSEDSPPKKKFCAFCRGGSKPIYTNVVELRKFVSSRGKIVPRLRSGICSKHQRALAREVKRARHLALLPFAVQV